VLDTLSPTGKKETIPEYLRSFDEPLCANTKFGLVHWYKFANLIKKFILPVKLSKKRTLYLRIQHPSFFFNLPHIFSKIKMF